MSEFVMGENGGQVISGAASSTAGEKYRAMQVIVEAIFTNFEAEGLDATSETNMETTIPVGVYLFDRITAVTISEGLVYLSR